MVPCTGGIHAQPLLRVSTIGLGDTQTVNKEGATCRTRKLGIVVEMHTASQYHVTLLLEGHGFHDFVDIAGSQSLGRHTKAVAAQGDYSNTY